MTLPELIDRLERATEGSRELDAEIFRLDPNNAAFFSPPWISHGLGAFRDTSDEEGLNIVYMPMFTDSIDDAFTVVPDVGWFDIAYRWAADHDPTQGRLWRVSVSVRRSEIIARARTLPLAICLAAMRARLAMEGGA